MERGASRRPLIPGLSAQMTTPGAAIGAGAGAGGGTATAYATGKRNIVLPSETRLSFRTRQPLSITRAT